ncbi:hypothetical protein EMPS_05809 [Entomortierella parvispora]|uniref:Uncharacterized protein n=1 Tax=Entomortierella parvispora TaxID=205924 RepID=A0A9P3LWM8_9FUNG|nr:hypothetical protein EMPS_05809 [Entomortierella parvispora]
MLSPPSYDGAVEALSADIVTLAYFKTTRISDWNLEGFLMSTGLTELQFLSSVKDIARIKRLPCEIQMFAKRLKDYYGGIFQDEVAAIAKNNALKEMNREILSGREHLLLQSRVNETIKNDQLADMSAEEYSSSSSSSWTLSTKLTGKRTSIGASHSSNKRRGGNIMVRGEDVDIEKRIENDGNYNGHDDADIETVVDGLNVAEKTTPPLNLGKHADEEGEDHEDNDSTTQERPESRNQTQDVATSDDDDLFAGQQTPPKRLQGHSEEVPLVHDSKASFRHCDDISTFTLNDEDQVLYNEAAKWFKSKLGRDTESTIRKVRDERFREPWVHDLLYDRLKLLRTGLSSHCDENTYTSFWITPDFVALQTGIPGLISRGFANENHFTPSAWRRAICRGKTSSKGTNVDAYYVARDNYVDIIFENIGSPTCTDHSKHREDKEKSCRNAADALLERFYNSTGSFEVAKEYKVLIVIVFGYEVSVYTANIKDANEFKVSKIFQGRYHFSKDVYLANLLVHLKFCLIIKTVMERNIDVSIQFGNSIESVPKEEEAHYNLRLHSTPTKGLLRRPSSMIK